MRTRNRSIASAVETFPSLAPVMKWLNQPDEAIWHPLPQPWTLQRPSERGV